MHAVVGGIGASVLPEMIVDALRSTISQGIEPHFADYVQQHRTTRWMMFSDYVLKQPNRPNDVFAFTLLPGGSHLASLNAQFAATATHDFKDIRKVSESMLRLLSDNRLFTFCFIVRPSRVITRNVTTLRGMLDQTISMMEKWNDADTHRELVDSFKAMRRKAASQSFNVRLIDNIILATTFAAFLTYLICKQARAKLIGWFSDRDSITTAHDRIANYFYGVSVSSFCQWLMEGWKGPELGLNGPVNDGNPLWCDAHLRAPDYFAGAISAWNIEQNTLLPKASKYYQILTKAVANQPNVYLIRLDFDWDGDRLAVSSSRVKVTRRQ